ncbi:hypothetical protein CC79DRAFT_1373835 [Sarocladium strictum]
MASQLAAYTMELSDDGEAVPLIEIPAQSITDRVHHDHVRHGRDPDEVDDTLSPSHVPDCFKDCKEVLQSPPTLWTDKTKRPPDSWPRKWIAARILCLWAAVLTNFGLAYLAYHMPESPSASAVFQVAPPLLATALMFIATQTSHRALHHSSQRPMGMEAFRRNGTLCSINRYFLIILLGPQLSSPILKFSRIEAAPGGQVSEDLRPMTPESEWTDGFAEFANFSSWADVVPSLEQLLPAQTSFFTARDLLKDWKTTETDIWVIHDESVQRELPSTVSFSLHRDGRGSAEHTWDGRDREEKHGVYMPVVPPKQPEVQDRDIRHSWQAPTSALGLGLKCDYITSDYISVTKSLGINGVAVKATDSNGCSASVALEKQSLAKDTRRAYLNLVGHLEDDAHTNLHGTALSKTLSFLQRQRTLLSSHGVVFAHKPSWSASMTTRDGISDRLCENKLFLASTMQSVMLDDSTPLEATQVQAASCSAVFAHGFVDLILERQPLLPLRGTTGRYKYASPTYDNITVRNYKIPYVPVALDEQAVERLTSALLDQDPLTHIWGSDWPLALLREKYEDHRWERASPVGTLRMIGKVLTQSFIGRISTSASRTLAEAMRVGYEPLVGSVLRWPSTGKWSLEWELPIVERLQNNVYQRSGIYSWYLIILLLILTPLLGRFFNADLGTYFSPWDLSSIATRLALLRHSCVAKVLRSIPIDGRYLDVSENTCLITFWGDIGRGEAVEWRIDAMNDQSITPQGGMVDSNMKPFFTFVALVVAVALHLSLISSINSYRLDNLRLQFYAEILEVDGLFDDTSLWISLVRSIIQIILFTLAFSWLPSLALAYQARQPWVALKLPQAAESSITLDYWNCFSPLWKAISHRHWTLALLSVGSLLQFGIPLSSALLYTRDHSILLTEMYPALREHGWKKDVTSLDLTSRETMEYVNLEFLNSLSSRGTTGSWATPVGALATTDVQRALPRENAAYGSFMGSLLSATLKCEETEVRLEVSMQRTNHGDLFAVDTLAFTSQDGLTGAPIEVQDPCRAVDKREAVDSRPWNLASFCGRWWLQNTTLYSGDESPQPTWLVVVLHGNATHRPDGGHMLFTKEPLVTGLVCKPRVSVQEGTVTVPGQYTAKGKSGRAELWPAKFKASSSGSQGETFAGVAGAVSQLLNTSVLLPSDHVAGGEDDESRLFGVDTFVGDLPSYAIYRHFDTGRLAKPDAIALAHAASHIFATYVSTLASSTGILKDTTIREHVQISYFRSHGRIKINKASFVFLISYFVLCCYVWAKYSRSWTAEYALPLEPVLLINSLQYLSNSEALISTMEREMPHPEKMSLREFHKKVELWGFKYQLKVRYKGGNRYVVLEIVDDANSGSQVPGPFGMVLTDDSDELYKDNGELLGTRDGNTPETEAGLAE